MFWKAVKFLFILPFTLIAAYLLLMLAIGPLAALAADVKAPKAIEPSFANAIEQVFGMAASVGSVKTASNELTSLLVDVPFVSRNKNFRAVFLKTQKFEEYNGNVNVVSCHVCGPSISAVVYLKTGKVWTVFSVSKFFTDFGSWGDATVSSPVEILYDIAPRTVAFLFDSRYSSLGYTNTGKAIFGLTKDGVRELGYIVLSRDNAGRCDNTIDEKKITDPFDRCWKNSGSYAVERDPNSSFSAIRVIRKGTEFGKDWNVVPARSWIYRFTNKKTYELVK